MKSEQLRALQAPLKDRYRHTPDAARIILRARGNVGDQAISCSVEAGRGLREAGLHQATGGDGSLACSGDMLLEALVACAGVTLKAVATAMDIPLRGATLAAEGDLDFRGTLGVSREARVGFEAIRLKIELDADAPPDQVERLIKLTERYCVVFQTLSAPPLMQVSHTKAAGS